MPLRPSCNNCQYWLGLFTPPGNRHPMPTTAIGSVSPCSAISRRALRSSILRNASVMIPRRSGDGAEAITLNPALPKVPFAGRARRLATSYGDVEPVELVLLVKLDARGAADLAAC